MKANQEFIYQSTIGVGKSENQDNLLVIEDDQFNLYAVFDGVSTAINSKRGTELAKAFVCSNYKSFINGSETKIDRLMYSCNRYLTSMNIPYAYTTYSIVIIYKDGCNHSVFSTMGDTRIYTITNQYIEQISKDDRLYLTKNSITKCLGMDFLDTHDFNQGYFEKGKQFVLICSDGFYDFLENDRMKFFGFFNKKTLKTIQENLDSTILNNNSDDSTYVFIR